eukprot:augustus_masked-scaffold_36-processed-gene-0.11-mRNA-1 protein AED:0.44 eAED:0.44 QI:0/-1/0/1/-1/1/1/0/557
MVPPNGTDPVGDTPELHRNQTSFFNNVLRTIGLSSGSKDYVITDDMSVREKDFYLACNRYHRICKFIEPEFRIHLGALFKQATAGDCNIPRPNPFYKSRTLKYAAWKYLEGVPSQQAASYYVEHLNEVDIKLQQDKKVSPPGATTDVVADKSQTSLNGKGFFFRRKQAKGANIESKLNRVLSVQDPVGFSKQVDGYFQSNKNLGNISQSKSSNLKSSSGLTRFKSQPLEDLRRKPNSQPQSNMYSERALPGKQEMMQQQVRPSSSGEEKFPVNRVVVGTGGGVRKSAVDPKYAAKFKPGKNELKRFTMMKITSLSSEQVFTRGNLNVDTDGSRKHVPSMQSVAGLSIAAESMLSFSRHQYLYSGENLLLLVNRHKVKTNLSKKSLMKGPYGEVLPIIYRLSVDINSLLDKSVNKSEALQNKEGFSGKNIPKLNLDLFILRMVRYLDKWFRDNPSINSAGCRSLMITNVYLGRIEQYIEGFKFTKYNIHKLLAVCMLLAAKFCEDCIIANSYWAQVAGFSIEEINQAEEIFCEKTNFDLYVGQKELDAACYKYDLKKI